LTTLSRHTPHSHYSNTHTYIHTHLHTHARTHAYIHIHAHTHIFTHTLYCTILSHHYRNNNKEKKGNTIKSSLHLHTHPSLLSLSFISPIIPFHKKLSIQHIYSTHLIYIPSTYP
jgi:hypothetical protein